MKKKLLTCLLAGSLLIGLLSISNASTIDLSNGRAFSFQDEGTTSADQTSLLKDLDGSWGPAATGTVIYDYYATGTSTGWFDAISLNFDLSGIGYQNISGLELRFYLQKGAYVDKTWEHYQVLQGAYNTTNEDNSPSSATGSIDFYSNGYANSNQTIGWISSVMDNSWITGDNFDITLRLWNARIDKIELVTESAPVPEPATMLLLGFGLLGVAGVSRRKN